MHTCFIFNETVLCLLPCDDDDQISYDLAKTDD